MCGRFHLETADPKWEEALEEAQDRLRRLNRAEISLARNEVFPGQWVPVLARGRADGQAFFPMLWGFSGPRLLINARSETAYRLPAYRDSWARRRCLIPFSRYDEWARGLPGRPRFGIRPDTGERCYLAGLYRFEAGETFPRFTVLTREASPDIRFIHPRMPVILPQASTSRWLSPAEDPSALLEASPSGMLAVPYESAGTEEASSGPSY